MWFLLRVAFWLTIVLVLLPRGESRLAPQLNVSAIEAVSAAKAAVSDVGTFCERQPDACEVGSQAAAAIGQRAQAGAKLLYEYLNEQLAADERGTGSTSGKAVPLPPARPGQHTLSPSDLVPAWRGPQPNRGA